MKLGRTLHVVLSDQKLGSVKKQYQRQYLDDGSGSDSEEVIFGEDCCKLCSSFSSSS